MLSVSKQTTGSLSWTHATTFSLAFVILAGVLRIIFVDYSDPLHCGSLLSRGTWLDHDKHAWQPEGCMMHEYQPSDVLACLTSRHIVFIGDEATMHLFYQFAHLLDPTLPTQTLESHRTYSDVTLKTKSSVHLSFYWDPYLNATVTRNYASPTGDRASYDRFPDRRLRRPAMIVLGSGLWYLQYAEGRVAAWEANTETLLELLTRSTRPAADDVVLLPVTQVIPSLLSAEEARTIRISDIEAMNSDLFHRIYPSAVDASYPAYSSSLHVSLPLVFNSMLEAKDTQDGLHYFDPIIQAQANILLNLRCNKAVSEAASLSATCCNAYPKPNLLQSLFLVFAISWGPVNWYMACRGSSHRSVVENTTAPLIISGITALLYFSDRTGFWLKEHQYYNQLTFAFFLVLILGVGIGSSTKSEKELGFLSREQTDEWKGWMQLIILIYHYFDASKITAIHNVVRVLVASYLFMTGYGHTSFYYTTSDFSFLRAAQVLLRLNLLTLLLSYSMNVNYLSYYFIPLVTMWFLVIYGTMVVGARFNQYTVFLLSKIILSSISVTLIMKSHSVMWWIIDIIQTIFGVQWSAADWLSRVNLDILITYAGMVTAVAVIKAREYRLGESSVGRVVARIAVCVSIVGLIWYLAFARSRDSQADYNRFHPWISSIPIISFVIIRNATPTLRNVYSKAFVWVGTCSLEIYIIQYHFLLAGNTQGLLVVIPGAAWRPLNFIVTTVIFFSVSKFVAGATHELVIAFCGPKSQSLQSKEDLEMDAGYYKLEMKIDSLPPLASFVQEPVLVLQGGRWERLWRRSSFCYKWILKKGEKMLLRFADWLLSLDWRTYGVKAKTATLVVAMWTLNWLWALC